MDKRRVLLTALVTLGMTLACGLLIRLPTLQNTVREGLIMPVVYLVWLVRLLIHSVDQPVLWGAAMLILGLGLAYGLVSAWPDAESMLRPGQRPRQARSIPKKNSRRRSAAGSITGRAKSNRCAARGLIWIMPTLNSGA